MKCANNYPKLNANIHSRLYIAYIHTFCKQALGIFFFAVAPWYFFMMTFFHDLILNDMNIFGNVLETLLDLTKPLK